MAGPEVASSGTTITSRPASRPFLDKSIKYR